MDYRGVVLAGGRGTRLGERTRATNKHLLPVGGEPMIFHPIKKLVSAGVRDILIVTGPDHIDDFRTLLGIGVDLGCSLTYRVQAEAGGIAQALALAENFVGPARSIVLLGDNIFFDPLARLVRQDRDASHAQIVLKMVADPQRYAVLVRDPRLETQVLDIEEKPAHPKGNEAVVGIYFYPPDVFDIIRTLKPSPRGELEITDVNRAYLRQGRLCASHLECYWTDAGTPESLAQANRLVTETPPLFA